jgi:hypothetical protein
LVSRCDDINHILLLINSCWSTGRSHLFSNRSSGTIHDSPPFSQVISLPQNSFNSNQEDLVFLFSPGKGCDVITFLLEVGAACVKRVIASETSHTWQGALRGFAAGPPRSVRQDKVDRSSTLSKGCDCRSGNPSCLQR